MSENFYKNLEAFNSYNEAFSLENYTTAPEDWFVIITDIKNSTIAVSNGKYKDVNLIGSACIGAVLSLGDYPFLFGGDGASFLIPPSAIDAVKSELNKIQNSAKNRYSLELRVGVVPVREILKTRDLKVAKYELAKGRYIAKFSGGGLDYADKLIKEDESLLLKSEDSSEAAFDKVSCRWNPVKNSQGVILTLMVKTENFDQYKEIQKNIDDVIGKDQKKINPIKTKKMTYMGLREMFKNEKNYENSFFTFSSIIRKIEIFFAYIVFNQFKRLKLDIMSKYTKSMETHSDYRKFDDTLRMVIDCSEAEVKSIISKLDDTPNLKYGYSLSDHALMTCLVFGLQEGEHIHFIDGADGGYTEAATMMKSQK